MVRKDLMALYGRLGLVVVAFAVVAGIIAGPLLQRVWSTQITVTEQRNAPAPSLPQAPIHLVADKEG
jgi:hypothetical protein